jgi:hypothetical protein
MKTWNKLLISSLLGLATLLSPSTAFTALSEADKAVIGTTNLITNGGAELGISGYSRYNGGTTAPTTMTGGTPTGNLTFSRTTTSGEYLAGGASFKVTKAAANAQGDGVSTLITIPVRATTRNLSLQTDFKVISGSWVQGDFKVFCYDVTNSSLITPFNNDLVGTQGTLVSTLSVSTTTASLRCGIHAVSTATTAVTFSFEQALKGETVAMGMAGSDWVAYTPTFTGFGTASSINFWYRQVGDSYDIEGKFVPGTTTATEARITLPNSATVDSTKVPSIRGFGGLGANAPFGTFRYNVLAEPGVGYMTFSKANASAGNEDLTKQNGSGIFTSGEVWFLHARGIPISGASSNVTMAQSSSFFISSYLVNGSRVTAAPASLGQYRCRYRTTTSSTTLADAAPSNLPSVANGMQIYGNVAWNAAGSSGNTQIWDIFVGLNKNVRVDFYSTTGRTGLVDTKTFLNGATEGGVPWAYDPTTGVVTVDAAFINSGSNTTRYLGTLPGSVSSYVTTGYFDVKVSENALAVGLQSPRSMIRVASTNGYGSSGSFDHIRRWSTTLSSTGTDITYADSSTNGGSFTINSDGVYALSASDNCSTTLEFGFSLNTTQGGTNIVSITQADRLAFGLSPSNDNANVAWTGFLHAGDVVREHTNACASGTSAQTQFTITKVSN